MYRLDLPADRREASLLERKRTAELQRHNRIFSSHTRTVGVDKPALDTQIQDKKLQEEIENKRKEAYAAQMKQNDQIASALDERMQRDVRDLNKAIDEFRLTFQKKEDRREYDLSDPEALKKELPPRVSDGDPRCTVSGVQRLLGEDLTVDSRRQMQQEQLREWSLQQQEEQARALEEQRLRDGNYDKMRVELDQKAAELQQLELQTRRAVCAATKDFNRAQAEETTERKKLERKQEEEDNSVEISNLINGDLLSEDPAQAASAFGPHRVVPDRWKGMSSAQLEAINNVQQQQIQERMRLREEERVREAELYRQRVQAARAMVLLERQQKREEKELRKAQDHMNLQLAQAQRAQKTYLDKEVFTNNPTDRYFEQFNTSSR
ncbi:hypothetical protein XENTR_v10007578 [Xenopus tropicalis]|uniref:RIB43A domain with coiled-coils 2 n=1 Tax=Xenopus tropicalis TaxID=8364 RepID=A0A7D9NKH2_XENTR|nr:RIB43A-like with coiled-coils protein 2 isoform X1 [Xenopus tropicalis]KAE8613121.1 hypothetical protein XENTR_v10007578 [Xenopus tropicalis]|eukprot:XP_004912508.1 PREDICTED: RIB43A-like with coiled-coils protein 2 [Xenopus tropicalis]